MTDHIDLTRAPGDVCVGCGQHVRSQTGYCEPCGAAADRLVARGIYFCEHTNDWQELIRQERGDG